MKRTIPLFIVGITGLVLIVSYFVPPAASWGDEAMGWFNILAAVAFVLGGGNLIKLNLAKISARRPGWGYAAVTLAAFLATIFVGLFKVGVPPSEEFPAFAWAGAYKSEGSVFWWLFEYVLTPLNQTMFALLAFYVASAAFRSFRAKNAEATVLLATAFLVMLGRTAAGYWLTSGIDADGPLAALRLESLADTAMTVFNLAGMRAIMIGIALGVIATSLKILLGVDRSYLGAD
jgi:hypothetical protein